MWAVNFDLVDVHQIPAAPAEARLHQIENAGLVRGVRLWGIMPSATTSLSIAGKNHKVEDYHGNPCAPAILRTLEDRIDAVAQSAQWVECEDTGYCAR